MSNTKSVLIVDDHELLRRGVRSLIETQTQYRVCGEASDGQQAVEMAAELKPDIIIMDLTLPRISGLEAIRRISKTQSGVAILVLSIHDSEQMIRESVLAGAHGYVLKTDGAKPLLEALDAMGRHEPYYTPRATEILVQELRGRRQPDGDPLTARERQILELIAEGKGSRDIGALLGIASKTADVHRANLMRKLNLHSVSELVRYAIRNNIVTV